MQRYRRNRSTHDKYEPGADYDHNLPYGGKVILAKKKRADSWMVIGFQVAILCLAAWLLYVAYYHQASLGFYTIWVSAHMGHDHAQHLIGQKYLQGHTVPQDHETAFYWFRRAADQGHPHSSYNLAVAHLKGFKTDIQHSEVRHLIRHAAKEGVPEAKSVMKHLCHESLGDCNDEILDEYHRAMYNKQE